MRTTLTIDDDILVAARGLAARQHKPIGEIISIGGYLASFDRRLVTDAVVEGRKALRVIG